ncbi:MAG TPA: ferredoxin reductase [Candidatus Dormibacteraeota bacterium]|nr:ferredoxin reductase [Candidatus Dormibacteraeota bacterium]HEV2477758.1 ferredoxin reductase [Candidatus Dormibacteraeota bacterium]
MTSRGPLKWQFGTLAEIVQETPRVASLYFDVPEWQGHLAGQHVDVRLTAEDGYVAERSYSIASAPEEARVALTVERLDDGEVSPYLVGELRVGDRLELRGPIGGFFVWSADDKRPLFLIAGGSGVVPLMAMLRHRAKARGEAPTRLLYSSRTLSDVIYREELDRLASAGDGVAVYHTLTREKPEGWKGFTRRVDQAMMHEVAWPTEQMPAVYICGPTTFVEAAASLLVSMGYPPISIKTERFGATGGSA